MLQRVSNIQRAILIVFLAAYTLVSSSSRAQTGRSGTVGDSPVAAQPAASTGPQLTFQAAYNNYRIKPKDTVHIQVFGESDMETTGRVDKDGSIAFPLLGTARIGGQTVQEATATMETLLREYLVHPQVSVSIVTYFKEHFTILGQVNKPGTYDMPDESVVDLLQAIGMAGGYTKIAQPSHIKVKRVEGGRQMLINLDGKKILNQKYAGEPVPAILPGDIIEVGESIF